MAECCQVHPAGAVVRWAVRRRANAKYMTKRYLAPIGALAITVIGGAIVERTKLYCVTCALKSSGSAAAVAFKAPILIRPWVLLGAAGVVALTVWLGRTIARSRSPLRTRYTADRFLDVDWHWNYYADDVVSLTPLCPRCQFQLSPIRSSAFRAIDHISLRCENCGFKRDFELNWPQVYSLVERLIHRSVRTGEYIGRIT